LPEFLGGVCLARLLSRSLSHNPKTDFEKVPKIALKTRYESILRSEIKGKAKQIHVGVRKRIKKYEKVRRLRSLVKYAAPFTTIIYISID
jgi:hypothetical protein